MPDRRVSRVPRGVVTRTAACGTTTPATSPRTVPTPHGPPLQLLVEVSDGRGGSSMAVKGPGTGVGSCTVNPVGSPIRVPVKRSPVHATGSAKRPTSTTCRLLLKRLSAMLVRMTDESTGRPSGRHRLPVPHAVGYHPAATHRPRLAAATVLL
jgi:hypothetical protein